MGDSQDEVEGKFKLPLRGSKMSEVETIELIDYFRVVWKRKWLIVIGTLVCLLTALGYSMTLPKVYQTSVTLMSTELSFRVQLEPRIQTRINSPISLTTYTEMIRNRVLAGKVAEILSSDFDLEGLTSEGLIGMVSVESVGSTNLIKMTVEGTDPEQVALIANIWADLFVKENQELSYRNTKKIEEFTVEQLGVAGRNLELAEDEARLFKETNQISELQNRIDGRLTQLVGYESRLNEIGLSLYKERVGLKTRMKQLVRIKLNDQRSRREEVRLELEKEQGNVKGILKQLVQDELASYRILLNNTTLSFDKEKVNLEEIGRLLGKQQASNASLKRTIGNSADPSSNSVEPDLVYVSLKEREIGSSLLVKELLAQIKRTQEAITSLSNELEILDENIANSEVKIDSFLKAVLITKSSIDNHRISSGLNSANSSAFVVLNNNNLSGDNKTIRNDVMLPDREVALGNSILAIQGLQLEIKHVSSKVSKLKAILDNIRFESYSKIENFTAAVDRILFDLSGVISIKPKEKDDISSSIISIIVVGVETERLRESIKVLTEEMDDFKLGFVNEQLRLTRLNRAVAIAEDTYRTLSQKNEETKISAATVTGNIEILEPAYPPRGAVKPKVRLNTLIAGVVGFMVAVGLAFFIEYVDKVNVRK